MPNTRWTEPNAQSIQRQRERKYSRLLAVCGLLSAARLLWVSACCLVLATGARGLAFPRAQQSSRSETRKSKLRTRSGSSFEFPVSSFEQEAPLPGDWAPELLDAILSSPNPDAADGLARAAFAAGRALVPQLKLALKDDRTAEFAAQALALIGGAEAFEILAKLVNDPRDLNLRRFYYGALGETDSAEAHQVLLDVIRRADAEPDRTVPQAAILALTVRSDLSLVPRLREIEEKLKDIVIRDDLDNALAVIESRARYLASPAGKKPAASLESAVRTYFAPALRTRPLPGALASPGGPSSPASAAAKVDIRNVVFAADKTRALARVIFEDPSAVAQYDMVLQKRDAAWHVASVWLGSEEEKPEPKPQAAPLHPK